MTNELEDIVSNWMRNVFSHLFLWFM